MLEHAINYMSSLSPFWIYVTLFFFAFIENVFPPSPSDVVIVFGATLISDGEISFALLLIITSFGSSLGFMLMYLVGKIFGEKIVRSGKLKFITPESIDKTDIWFRKYGYKLIAANRFLPGTRSVISFFSGFTELGPKRTFVLATISAFLWNVLVIYLGISLGNNVERIDYYLTTYSNIIIAVTVVVIIYLIIHNFILKKRAKKS